MRFSNSENNRKIIITGANGFLGSNLCSFLETRFEVVKLSFLKFSKLKEKKKIKYLCKFLLKHKPYAIIHLATYFSKNRDKETLKKCLEINYHNSKILFNYALKYSVKKFIYTGSNYEFLLFKKKEYPYLISKKKFSSFLKTKKITQMNLISLYLSNVFGINDRRKKLINYLIKNKKNKKKIKIYGSSNSKLNFVHINDVIKIIYLSLRKRFKKKKNFFIIKYPTDILLEKVILIFSNYNKNISFEKIKNIKKDYLIKENDIFYKNKKFPYYKPKINFLNWIKKVI